MTCKSFAILHIIFNVEIGEEKRENNLITALWFYRFYIRKSETSSKKWIVYLEGKHIKKEESLFNDWYTNLLRFEKCGLQLLTVIDVCFLIRWLVLLQRRKLPRSMVACQILDVFRTLASLPIWFVSVILYTFVKIFKKVIFRSIHNFSCNENGNVIRLTRFSKLLILAGSILNATMEKTFPLAFVQHIKILHHILYPI